MLGLSDNVNNNHNILIHIGYHKTGTSWLQNKFFENPISGINSVAKYKDRPRWVTEVIKPFYLYDEAKVLEYFEGSYNPDKLNVFSLERLAGYPSTGGYDSLEIAQRLKSLFPNAKILIVVREQFSMIKSHYIEYLKANGTAKLEELLTPKRFYLIRNPIFQLKYFDYIDLINVYDKLFGKDTVLVLPYELMKEDSVIFIEYICKFGEIKNYEKIISKLPLEEKVNVQILPRDAYINRTYSRVFGSNNSLETLISNRSLKFLFNIFYKKLPINYGGILEKEIKTTMKKHIPKDYYLESNILLEQRIKYHHQIDLKTLGYTI
ncbi:sulfotransferase domain-containing protein [Winogradskyella undariae]|uniref:sulfotransferase domain-containing protein n=1 Tax=Winogradskyella undariae TaxID=1285465 RepID=UPI0015CAAFEA|nr:sulfotransferase domain-containing protein [Winogradskyella undariae]